MYSLTPWGAPQAPLTVTAELVGKIKAQSLPDAPFKEIVWIWSLGLLVFEGMMWLLLERWVSEMSFAILEARVIGCFFKKM